MANLFIVAVDRDCVQARQHSIDDCAAQTCTPTRPIFGCLAIEEVEVWALALHRRLLNDDWMKQVRTHCHPQETYFEPFAKSSGWFDTGVGKGRKAAMSTLRKKGKWDSLKQGCPEVVALMEAIHSWLAASAVQ